MEPRAKLVCTIGPGSIDRVEELAAAGMDVARINLSHATPAEQETIATRAHAAGAAVLVDLPGPKVRLGDLAADVVELSAGASVRLVAEGPPGNADRLVVAYPGLADDLEAGDTVLLADGAVELRVVTIGDDVRADVVRGGLIRPHAGVSLPSERLSLPPLTDADRAAVGSIGRLAPAFVAQSFVRRAADVAELRSLLGPEGPPIMAKIETRGAVDDFDAICATADAVMIARGDLGVELPYEEVPVIQKNLVRHALDRGVPTVVATQMLESMTAAPRPTRAEASDVANAIFDGADAIMLSAETAIGAFPVVAAEAATRIARACAELGAAHVPSGRGPDVSNDADALAFAAVTVAARDADVAGIACYTRTGRTARILASLRPRVPILAYCPDPRVAARLAVVHGVEPRTCDVPEPSATRLELMAELARDEGSLPAGAAVVLVASTAEPGTGPNLLEVRRV
jgi:pyruvate kinase